MKRYEFKVVIEEGNDEYWESLEDKTGCDEITEIVLEAIQDSFGGGGEVTLVQYSNEPDTLFNK